MIFVDLSSLMITGFELVAVYDRCLTFYLAKFSWARIKIIILSNFVHLLFQRNYLFPFCFTHLR